MNKVKCQKSENKLWFFGRTFEQKCLKIFKFTLLLKNLLIVWFFIGSIGLKNYQT